MAGRRRGRSGPYRFTNNRRAALRRAQMISAKKRRRNAKITVGVLAAGAVVAYGGYKYGPGVKEGVAKQVASFKPRMADMRNKMAGIIAVDEVTKKKTREKHALAKPSKKKKRNTPTATNPNSRKKMTVKEIPQEDPQKIRDALKEELGKNTIGGNAAKRQAERGYNDDLAQTIKDGPVQGVEKALRGKKVKTISERTARRNIGKRNAILAAAGGKVQTKAEIDAEIKGMIEDGIVRPRTTTNRTMTRKPRGSATPRTGRRTRRTLKSPATSDPRASQQVMWTDAQMQAAYGMEY